MASKIKPILILGHHLENGVAQRIKGYGLSFMDNTIYVGNECGQS